jgi:hypothetical protein
MGMNRETFVFGYDTPEQRTDLMALLKPYMLAEEGIRITAVSVDHEMRRVSLIEEAIERRDVRDKLEVIEEILECPDLSEWSWE